MGQRTCATCETPFTPTHGRQRYCSPSHRRDEHPKITKTCDGCGANCTKERRAKRYARTFCTDLCRDFTLHGPTTCVLPRYHIARWAGRSSTWTPPKPTSYECEWCGKAGKTDAQPKRYCDTRCKTRAKRVRRRGAEHNATGTYTWAEIARLWTSFGEACAYCRTPTPLADIHAEHVEALSCGGANNLTNLLPSCAACNCDKRDLTLDRWAIDRQQRKLPPVITTWSRADARYRHLSLRPRAMA